jgi:hypothetical protein
MLSTEEDILVYWVEGETNASVSPFPTVGHLEHSTLDHWDKSGCQAFHNSTALITTTSLIVSGNYLLLLCL